MVILGLSVTTRTLITGQSYIDLMEWKGRAKATVKTTIVSPTTASLMKTIKFENPINLEFENDDLEWEPHEGGIGPGKPKTIKTQFGVIWIRSKHCIQISHVKNPDDMDKLEKFIHNVLFKHEKTGFIAWLERQDKAFERDLRGE